MNKLDYISENQSLKKELEQVKAERDAAIDDITKCCLTCRNNCFPSVGGCCIENNYYNWTWRGRSDKE